MNTIAVYYVLIIMSGIRNIQLRSLQILLLTFTLLVQSCTGGFNGGLPDTYEWKPYLAFPIGEADFGLDIGVGFDTLLLEIDSAGLPAWASLPVIPFSGTLIFDFEEVLGQRNEIESVLLRVNAYNGFPVEIGMQGYLYSEQGVILDSLFSPALVMERGILSGGGETQEYGHTQTDIPFDSGRLDLLVQTSRIDFEGSVSNVDYFPAYNFKVQMGAVIGVRHEFQLTDRE